MSSSLIGGILDSYASIYLFLFVILPAVAFLVVFIGSRIAKRNARKRTKTYTVKVYAKGQRSVFPGGTEYYMLLQDYTGVKAENYKFLYTNKNATYVTVSEKMYSGTQAGKIYTAYFLENSPGNWKLVFLQEVPTKAKEASWT